MNSVKPLSVLLIVIGITSLFLMFLLSDFRKARLETGKIVKVYGVGYDLVKNQKIVLRYNQEDYVIKFNHDVPTLPKPYTDRRGHHITFHRAIITK